MTFQQELNSWKFPSAVTTSTVPEVGAQAPSIPELQLPNSNGKPTFITFLRHCGCPFAEKSFIELRNFAGKHKDVNFVAVSHSDEASTEKWITSVGGELDTEVIVDTDRELYAQWGLGVCSTWHILNPWSMYNVYKLGKSENIWNKPTESGSRWQTSGSFAVDKDGIIKWVDVAKAADAIPDIEQALKSVGVGV